MRFKIKYLVTSLRTQSNKKNIFFYKYQITFYNNPSLAVGKKMHKHNRFLLKNGAGARSVTVNRLVVGSLPTQGDEIFT